MARTLKVTAVTVLDPEKERDEYTLRIDDENLYITNPATMIFIPLSVVPGITEALKMIEEGLAHE